MVRVSHFVNKHLSLKQFWCVGQKKLLGWELYREKLWLSNYSNNTEFETCNVEIYWNIKFKAVNMAMKCRVSVEILTVKVTVLNSLWKSHTRWTLMSRTRGVMVEGEGFESLSQVGDKILKRSRSLPKWACRLPFSKLTILWSDDPFCAGQITEQIKWDPVSFERWIRPNLGQLPGCVSFANTHCYRTGQVGKLLDKLIIPADDL